MASHGKNRPLGFQTRAIHHGYDPAAMLGSVTPPIFMTSTYAFEFLAEFRRGPGA